MKTDLASLFAWVRTYSGESELQLKNVAETSRTWSDCCASWQKWHSDALEPDIVECRKLWYILLERARVETLSSTELEGMRSNLNIARWPVVDSLTPEGLYTLARRIFSDPALYHPVGMPPTVGVVSPFGFWERLSRRIGYKKIPPRVGWAKQELREAAKYLDDQRSFQISILPLLELLPDLPRPTAADEQSLFPVFELSDSTVDASYKEEAHDELIADATKDTREESAEHQNVQSGRPYEVFSRRFDEVALAQKWLDSSDRESLALLESPDRQRIRNLARQLQRRLLARRCPRWEFDCTEGVLDSRKLTRLITTEDDHRVFRQEIDSEENEAFICFLVDLSGSMCQERRVMAALTLDMALHTLDQCSISAEALGYTTRYFQFNPLMEAWRSQGSPPGPGRLNAARHIVLKDRKHRWRSTRESLALLLRDDFGCENLDGEALDWAARRLAIAPEKRKILVVLSDGEPYDEATEASNGPLYLEDHLRLVIRDIESSGVRLCAIGFGSQVRRFYRNSLSASKVGDLPDLVFDRIGELLLSKAKPPH